jgi:RNA polymerase sigma-70 factor (ECF subfamily)
MEPKMELVTGQRIPWGVVVASEQAPQQPAGAASREDRDDIAASLGGDEEAFARLVRRYQAEIVSQLWKYTRDPVLVEELAQEVFVEAYLGLRGFRGHAPFLHWLRRIATRVGYRYWRRQSLRRERETAYEPWHDQGTSSPEPGSAAEAADRVQALLAELPPRDRLVLTLLYLEELDTHEIAARTGWSRALVKVQAFRARQKLRSLLERRGFDG